MITKAVSIIMSLDPATGTRLQRALSGHAVLNDSAQTPLS